jgi:hypothetical protein
MVNFNLSTATAEIEADDWRWCEGSRRLGELGGRVEVSDEFEILEAVQQGDTQWSVVYEPAKLKLHAATGRRFGVIHEFGLVR